MVLTFRFESNISLLRNEAGLVKLTDMGLAKVVVGKTYTTHPDLSGRTPPLCPHLADPAILDKKGLGRSITIQYVYIYIYLYISIYIYLYIYLYLRIYRRLKERQISTKISHEWEWQPVFACICSVTAAFLNHQTPFYWLGSEQYSTNHSNKIKQPCTSLYL